MASYDVAPNIYQALPPPKKGMTVPVTERDDLTPSPALTHPAKPRS